MCHTPSYAYIHTGAANTYIHANTYSHAGAANAHGNPRPRDHDPTAHASAGGHRLPDRHLYQRGAHVGV